MDRFEAAARGAYICFRSAGGKPIIVKRLWACYMEKALYKCTTLLYFTLFVLYFYYYSHSLFYFYSWSSWVLLHFILYVILFYSYSYSLSYSYSYNFYFYFLSYSHFFIIDLIINTLSDFQRLSRLWCSIEFPWFGRHISPVMNDGRVRSISNDTSEAGTHVVSLFTNERRIK